VSCRLVRSAHPRTLSSCPIRGASHSRMPRDTTGCRPVRKPVNPPPTTAECQFAMDSRAGRTLPVSAAAGNTSLSLPTCEASFRSGMTSRSVAVQTVTLVASPQEIKWAFPQVQIGTTCSPEGSQAHSAASILHASGAARLCHPTVIQLREVTADAVGRCLTLRSISTPQSTSSRGVNAGRKGHTHG
jgi:hypothetical protein